MIGHRVSLRVRVRREGCFERLFHSSTFSSSRPKPTVRREILVLIHLLCRRSFRSDGSPSLRLFALGLRANKVRLLGPCCLGGSPSRFIDITSSSVFFSALGGSSCFRILLPSISLSIILFSFASPCGGVLFLLFGCWCHVACRLFSCLLISWLLSS